MEYMMEDMMVYPLWLWLAVTANCFFRWPLSSIVMSYLLNMVNFHSYVKLAEGIGIWNTNKCPASFWQVNVIIKTHISDLFLV